MTVFLLGAGFNADATAEAGPIYGPSTGTHQIPCGYPLLADLPRICFERESLAPGESVEHLLAEAQANDQRTPLERLSRAIMRADYYLVPEIIRQDKGKGNCYARFFNRFQDAQFLTFNYDSLVDLFLFRRGLWFPEDGYGVPVLADRSGAAPPPGSSKSLVLHLHGTFCLYISDHQFIDRTGGGVEWYEDVNPPRYVFDPDTISGLFRPYRRTMPTFGYEPVGGRIVAPVPDKTTGLQGQFVQRMYQRAEELLDAADVLITIGYGFGPNDEASHIPLLLALQRAKTPRLVIVDPAANSIAARLQPRMSNTNVCALDWTLKQWVERDCPLSRTDAGV